MFKKLIIILALAIIAFSAKAQSAFAGDLDAYDYHGGSYDGYALGTNIRYWVASADGNWNDTANWSDTSAGTGGFSVPSSGEVAVFDSGSTEQCTVNLAAVSLLDLIMTSGYTGASAKIISNGNLTLAGALNVTGGTLDISTNANTLTATGTLTIDGGTLTATNGNIDANGAVVISSGTLTAPTTLKSFTVAGNWTKSGGTFTSGTGTVTFDAGSGTQQVTSGGVTDNDDFYNITHSGAGTLQLQDAMAITHDLANSAGIWDANGKAMTIYEDFANTAAFTHNNNSVTFRGASQSDITGNNTFYNLTIDTNTDGAKAVRFGASQTQTVAGTLSITGYAAKVLTIRSTTDGTQATIDIASSIASGVDYLDIKDSKVNGQNHTITAGAHSVDSGNNTNWIFGGGTARTITGSLYQSNRSTKLTNQTVKLSVNGASPVQQAASSGDFTFNNILLSSGDKILAWIDDDATYEGNAITVSDGNNLTGFAIYAGHVAVQYETGSSITNANLSTAKGSLTDDDIKYSVTSGNLTVSDSFKFYIPAAYTYAPGGTITVDDIEIDGTLNSSGSDVTVSGDWDNSTGSYTSGNNTTTLDTTATAIIAGSTTFNNFTCTTAGKTLTFADGTIQTINGVFTITGVSGNLIKLQGSGTSGWAVSDSGTESVYYADVTRSTATNSITAHNSYNRENNTNWAFQMVDPYGVVFDSVSNNPIKGATVSLYTSTGTLAGSAQLPDTAPGSPQVNPQTTGADGAYQWDAVPGDYYITVSASGYTYPSFKTTFPSGRTIVTGSKGETFTVATTVLNIDQPLDSNSLLLKVKKDANKKEATVGDIVTYTVTIQNPTASDVTGVYLEDKIPAGFKYISGKAILDNVAISDPAGVRSLTFNIGTIIAGQTRTLKYQLVVGSGVSFGNYANTAFAKYADGTVISNQASKTVKVVPDPLFDLGTVIGKVFWDRNENGIQDQGEEPIPNVQIATEEGTLITTDKDGKYHLPAIIPGRHLFRLDERTLPQGAYLTTDKVVIVDITSGILAKVNFGINGQDEGWITESGGKAREVRERATPVNITQDRNRPAPRLNVSLLKEGLIIKDGKFIGGRCEFRIFTNYSLFIDKWKLEILDKDTKALVRAFEGNALDIHQPVYWDGKDKYGKLLNKERRYLYMLSVTDKSNRIDTTRERPLTISDEGAETTQTEQDLKKEKEKWLDLESKVNNLDRQNIKIDGETILVHSVWQPTAGSIRVMKDGKLAGEISVAQPQQSSPSEVLAAPQKLEETRAEAATDIILPKGEYDIEIASAPSAPRNDTPVVIASEAKQSKEGIVSAPEPVLSETNVAPRNDEEGAAPAMTKPKAHVKHIKVGEDYLFFVGMGDTKMGYSFNRGNIEPAGSNDKFREGFWSEGKLAYYLKGKIKGKYLITSSLDTKRDKKELFRNLDPNKYYPVYGDSSSINYAATNTQGPFYLLVEWDKSSALWGDYNTSITDTEFAQFNRSLYGGKIYYEDVATTQFGEPKTKLIVFRARAKQKAAHNEFVGTGGSLYYLKNKDAVEGSEKIKIEVRDKITGLVLTSKEMQEGSDYQIDYTNGRIIFWRPVAQIVESESIISSSLLGGNPVYVVADYEYAVIDKYDQGTQGGRIQQSLTDYLRVGGTYVKEEQLDKNYELKGADTILHLGKNIKLTGEYAETQSEALGSFVSTDGGISFTEMATADSDKGKAYGLKAEAYLLGRLGLAGYYKQIEKGFSSAATTAQQGKELMGLQAALDITSKTRLLVTHDIQKLIDGGNPQTQLQVGAQKTETTTAQITHEATQKLKFTGEYRRQQVTEKKDQFESETNTESNVAALKADYQATKKTALSLEQQVSLSGAPNQQTTLGVVHKPNEWLSLRGKETVGNQGTATGVGASANLKDKFELSSDYTKASYKGGGVGDTVSLGGRAMVDDKTEVHTIYAVTDSSVDGKTESVVYGSKRKVNDEVEIKADRTYAKSQDTLTEGLTYGLAREKDGRKLEGDWTKQRSQNSAEASDTNIFGLSGDINDKWAAQGSFERGKVQNFDGTQAERNAGSFGLGFVDTDKQTGETKLKASTKLELRLDNGEANKRQYLVYNAIEGRINPNTTLFAKANLSQTKNTTANSTEAQYKELVTGVAYRSVNFDRLNLLARYTYLENNAPSGQSDISSVEREKSHILAGEAVYDLTDKWQFVEKLALKFGEEKVSGFEFTKTQTWLMIQRINYNINRDWQVGGEYRRLTQNQAKDYKQGVLVEVARKVGEFIQVGLGYNFTDFNDDLAHLNYTAQGPFVRLTGKFYDRTPEEIERARQKWLERMIKQWAGELVNEELANPDSPVMQELYKYFYTAEKLRAEGRLKESGALYEKILQIGNIMYQEAEVYVRNRIELEKALKENDRLARLYYKEGKLGEAKALWQKIIKEAEPVPIYLKF